MSCIVRRGRFVVEHRGQANNLPVCVKSAKSVWNDTLCLKALLAELKILIYLEKHENIANLIGADTMGLRRGILHIFVEPCPLGNLHSYLQKWNGKFISLVQDDKFSNIPEIPKEPNYKISTANLLLWASQISTALEFLSHNKIVHGDLSATNVSMVKKDLVKVTNIGICRKYRELSNIETKELISWRWMPAECLIDGEFSFKSDVWSFGITIWEIFSLGTTPYTDLTWMSQFPQLLKQNLRMQKPSHATKSLYSFMLDCWKDNPAERPTAENVVEYFSKLQRESLFQNYHLLLDEDEGDDIAESTV